MDHPPRPHSASQALFQVYLRLRPPLDTSNTHYSLQESPTERFIVVERETSASSAADVVDTSTDDDEPHHEPKHITLQPPTDSRKRAVEKFAFTKVFEEEASQLALFTETGCAGMVRGVLDGERGSDALVATLGVTGSGKSHTILGSKSQRGLTQMSLSMLFQSLGSTVQSSAAAASDPNFIASLSASDPSEAHITSAPYYLESTYGENWDRPVRGSRAPTPMVSGNSRAQTPMTVWHPQKRESGYIAQEPIIPELPSPMSISSITLHPTSVGLYPKLRGFGAGFTPPHGRGINLTVTPTIRMVESRTPISPQAHTKRTLNSSSIPTPDAKHRDTRITTRNPATKRDGNAKDISSSTVVPRRYGPPPNPAGLPQFPDVSDFAMEVDLEAEHVVIVSMYEVYNDRIFDLLSPSSALNNAPMTRQAALGHKDNRRRPLLFKSTEASPDRKVVAGLKKIVCGSHEEAMMVLETGLLERRVAGTGSNNVSSRSHGFFCVEVKRKVVTRTFDEAWEGKTLTIVDLAGSERARNAKTAGATLAEAGKINESLMYLGQCLQLQSDCQEGAKPTLVPYRQCKLTELLFTNAFAPHSRSHPQKAIMIVTADPYGDFNATSQILRYSALAREVTVPRIPSVTSTIFSGSTHIGTKNHPSAATSGRTTPHLASVEELELAASEIARLSDECDLLAVKLTEEEIRANEAEMQWRAAEERAEMMEMEVREEVWGEVESRLEEERRRWLGVRDEDREMTEGFLDRKLELLGKTVKIFEDPAEPGVVERNEELERENETLRAKIAVLERELQGRSPTTKGRTRSVSSKSLMKLRDNNKEGSPTKNKDKSPTKKMKDLNDDSPVKKSKTKKPWSPSGGGADENIPLTLIDLTDSGDEGTSIVMADRMSSLNLDLDLDLVAKMFPKPGGKIFDDDDDDHGSNGSDDSSSLATPRAATMATMAKTPKPKQRNGG